MRTLFLSTMVTLDGFIAGPGGELDCFDIGHDDGVERHMADQLADIDAMLFGRVTYEMLAEYWPTAEGDTRRIRVEQARLMNAIPKLVISRGSPRLTWGPAQRIGDDLAAEIAKMKEQPGKDIALFAGAAAISAVDQHDLVDEYRLVVYPVILGKGMPLFGESYRQRSLRLVDVRRLGTSGVVLMRYRKT